MCKGLQSLTHVFLFIFQETSSIKIWSIIWARGFKNHPLTTSFSRPSERTCTVTLCLVSPSSSSGLPHFYILSFRDCLVSRDNLYERAGTETSRVLYYCSCLGSHGNPAVVPVHCVHRAHFKMGMIDDMKMSRHIECVYDHHFWRGFYILYWTFSCKMPCLLSIQMLDMI